MTEPFICTKCGKETRSVNKDGLCLDCDPLPEAEKEKLLAMMDDFDNRGLGNNISAAMLKLQEIRESEDFCCIEVDSDFDFVWDIRFAFAEPEEGHLFRTIGSYHRLDDAIEKFYYLWKTGKLRALKPRRRKVTWEEV